MILNGGVKVNDRVRQSAKKSLGASDDPSVVKYLGDWTGQNTGVQFTVINIGGGDNGLQQGRSQQKSQQKRTQTQNSIETASEEIKDLKKAVEHIPGRASGGYVGTWSDNTGKLARLHSGEYVLNKDDTENFFKAIDYSRKLQSASQGYSEANIVPIYTDEERNNILIEYLEEIVDTLRSFYTDTMKIYDDMLENSQLATTPMIYNIEPPAQAGTSNYNVTATFPNAGNLNEIQNALLNLPNVASQRMNTKTREALQNGYISHIAVASK